MADAKQCDICGKFYIPVSVYERKYGIYRSGLLNKILDTCPSCETELIEFIEKLKGENE